MKKCGLILLLNNNNKEIYLKCVCGSEILEVSCYDYNIEDYHTIDFSVYRHGRGSLSLRWRLKYIWRLLLGKDIKEYWLELEYKDLKRLISTLKKMDKIIEKKRSKTI